MAERATVRARSAPGVTHRRADVAMRRERAPPSAPTTAELGESARPRSAPAELRCDGARRTRSLHAELRHGGRLPEIGLPQRADDEEIVRRPTGGERTSVGVAAQAEP